MKKLNLKKLTSLVVMLAMLVTIASPFGTVKAKAADAKTFDLVEITDFHGTLEDTSGLPVGAVLAKDIKDVKAANPDRTLIIGGGDLYQGSPMSNVLKGVPVQKALSNIGMEVTALGNHEFDWGLNTITDTTMKDAAYSIVCANLYDKTTNKRVFDPYKIITKDGVKIAVIGAITKETPDIVLPLYTQNVTFTDAATEVNAVAKEIRDNKLADVVIAVVHAGNNYGTETGEIFDIANKLTGVDALFGGHSHTILNTTANGMPVMIANNAGKGYIDAKMTYADGKVTFNSTYVDISDATKPYSYKAASPSTDPDVAAIVSAAKKDVGPTFNEIIGVADKDLTRTQNAAPSGESYLGDWMADVVKNEVGADVGFVNNGGIRIDIPKGLITVDTLFRIMPFDNTICWYNMTKAQLKVVLEQAFMDGGKGIQLSGLQVTYNSANGTGNRVIDIRHADGTPISDTETLKVAAPDFMMTGGDGFKGFVDAGGAKNGLAVNDTHIVVRDALIKNVRANKTIVTTMGGRISNLVKTINVVGTSDLHGTVYPLNYFTGATAPGGLAMVSAYVNNLRALNPNVALVDVGDTIQGTPLVNYYNMIDTTSEYPMMKAMGAMKYDTWTLGNHEFNFGLATLNRVIADAEKEGIHVLSANTRKTADDSTFVEPYYIKTFNINGKEFKVGILGLTTKTIPSWEDPAHYAGLKFNDLVDDAKYWVPKVKAAGADVIIATIHSGVSSPSDTIPENQVDAVATQVSGIDAIICGHAHAGKTYTFKNPDGKVVPVAEPKNTDNIFSQVNITVDAMDRVIKVEAVNNTLTATSPVDSNITTLIQPYQDATLKYTNTVIGKSTGEFTSNGVETQPIALMDLIHKTQMKYAGTQLSIAAPLSATAYIPSGDIKIQDIMSLYIYENFLFGVKMTGKQIKAWMEYSMRYYKQTTSASDPIVKDPVLNVPLYNLDTLYGATYDVDLSQPVGQRIKNLKYNGTPIKDDDVFTVAINNYRFNGGGGFMAAAGLTPGDTSIVTYDSAKALGDDGQIRNMIINLVKEVKEISPTIDKSWQISTTPVSANTNGYRIHTAANVVKSAVK